jgi:hypothetical protein
LILAYFRLPLEIGFDSIKFGFSGPQFLFDCGDFKLACAKPLRERILGFLGFSLTAASLHFECMLASSSSLNTALVASSASLTNL